jgi:predicted nucleotidyltransferase
MTTKSIRKDPILEALFTSQARVEILKLLFLRSSNRHYLREVTALTRQPLRAVQRELARLESAGLIQSTREGNRKYFQANRESSVFPEIRALLVKTAGLGDLISGHLSVETGSIVVAFLFGSFARGTESTTSDVDLLVIGDMSGRDLSRLLAPARVKLGREINPVIMRSDEVRKKIASEDPFILALLREPKTFLIGGENDLQRLVGAGTSEAS